MQNNGDNSLKELGEDTAEVSGIVRKIRYKSEDNVFVVVTVNDEKTDEEIDIVGPLSFAREGDLLRAAGTWEEHQKYGRQLKAVQYEIILPESIKGIYAYLSSGRIKGIGPKLADRIIKHLGLETLRIMDGEPKRLLEIRGIGRNKLMMIQESWKEDDQYRRIMIFLQGLGISSTMAAKIYNSYSSETIAKVRENPYRLAREVYGIGFRIADRIAGNMGIGADSIERAEAGIVYALQNMAENGHVCCPCDELLSNAREILKMDGAVISAALEKQLKDETLVSEDGMIYWRPFYLAERWTGEGLKRLMGSSSGPCSMDDKAMEWLQKTIGLKLTEGQIEAVEAALRNPVSVITGGPGVGKTTILYCIVRLLERQGLKVSISAPTGRAAKRLSECTGRDAKTIHRLLKYSPYTHSFECNHDNPLEADAVIVDEVSMVDIELMAHLVDALKDNTSLVLVGDVDQLPSVGPGSVLRDIIDSGVVPVVRLKEIFRQAKNSRIVYNAHRVNSGLIPEFQNEGELTDCYFIKKETPEEVLDTIKSLCLTRIRDKFGYDPMEDIQVISPMHRGITGTANLNKELQDLLNPDGRVIKDTKRVKGFRVGDKVMQIINNYDKWVFNGDMGIIGGYDEKSHVLTVSFDRRIIEYKYDELEQLADAYAVTVHKSQGCEYPVIIMPILTQHFLLLQRNLLYTAMTRAKNLLILIGSVKALAMAVKNDDIKRRYSLLKERLGG